MTSDCSVCSGSSEPWLSDVIDPQSGETFDIVRCTSCRLGHTLPRPQHMQCYYGNQYAGGRHGWAASYCDYRRIALCCRVTRDENPRRLLDIGCGDGTFMRAMQKRGFEVAGVERYSNVAKDASESIIFDNIQDAARHAPYDLVTMWHVFEHLPDPKLTLQTIAAMTHSKSLLIIAVPNAGSFESWLMGKAWLHWDVPRHLYHFERSSLRAVLQRCGWEMRHRRASEFEYDLMGWSVSLLNRLGFERNLLFKILTGRSTTTPRLQRWFAFFIAIAVSAIVCVPVYLAGRMGYGGTLVVTATKRSCIGNV